MNLDYSIFSIFFQKKRDVKSGTVLIFCIIH